MSYVGSSAAVIPVGFSGVNSQSFNGDGSTVAFTLNRPVSAVNAIEVMVNNVQQSPYDGSYSVSSTTLTFSAAPSSGTANIYVVYRDFPVGSITDTSAVQKTGDTMTGDLIVNTNVGIGTSSPAAKLDIIGPSAASSPYLSKAIQFAPSNFLTRTWSLNYDDGGASGNGFNISAASTKILYLNANGNVGIGTSSPDVALDVVGEAIIGNGTYGVKLSYSVGDTAGIIDTGNSANKLSFRIGNSEKMSIDSAGRVTMPYQPGCLVQFVGNAYTGGSGTLNISSTSSPVTYYNDGSHFSFSNAQFTAPVSGKYLVTIIWYYGSGGSSYLGVVPTVNGSSVGMYWYNNASNYSDASVMTTRVVKVSALDQIGVQIYANSSDNNPDLLFNVQYLG